MTRTKRSFTPEERLTLLQDVSGKDTSKLAARTIYQLPYIQNGNNGTSLKALKD